MKIFVTGCGKAVPTSERADEGYLATEAAKNACTKEGAGLLIVQNHEQAKLMCRGCPKCGPIAPHLAVIVGEDRTRTLAEPAPEPPASGTPEYDALPMHLQADADQAAHYEAMKKDEAMRKNTQPPAPADDKPAWMRELLQAATPAPQPQAPTPAAEPAAAPEPLLPEPPPPEPLAPAPEANAAAGAAFDAAMTHPATTPPILSLLSPDVNTGPSVMGSSTLRAFQLCMRAGFYRIMKGIRRRRKTESFDDRGKPRFDPLALGTLVHGVLARFYQGRENPYDFLEAIKPHYPNIVEETKRLCTLHFNAYAERDRQVLDTRFVEMESRYYFKKKRVKSAKVNLSLCVSSKHDLGYRKMRPDEPRLPPGVVASAITIMDHKTIGYMTQDAQTSYRHDPQIFTNAITYERGNSVEPDGTLGAPSAEVFGPLTHFGINLIGKAMHHDPTKHLVRLTQIIPRDLLDSYADDIQQWLYTELADRMFHPMAQDDETWPKSYLCRDPSTGRPCAYVELCERGGLKRVNPAINYAVGEPYDPLRLIRPEEVKTGRKAKAHAAADVERK